MTQGQPATPEAPLVARGDHGEPSLFRPENLLVTARRQKSLKTGRVPEICILDPDGDLVRFLRRTRLARRSDCWACFHTELWEFELNGLALGIVGFAVGAPFAVMVAEQLFASGCTFLLSLGSAGQVQEIRPPPYYVLIARALRDEGTSYHYLPPAPYAIADAALLALAVRATAACRQPVLVGDSWTTDAPYRETERAVETAQRQGLLAVEMEAAGLYAFAAARRRSVLCLAQVTNCLARRDSDFDKGEADGVEDSLTLVSSIARRWRAEQAPLAARATRSGNMTEEASCR